MYLLLNFLFSEKEELNRLNKKIFANVFDFVFNSTDTIYFLIAM